MSSKRRSSRSLGKTLKFLFTGKWLRKIDLSSMDRMFSRRAKAVGRIFAPKWLTTLFTNISRRLKRVEKSVSTAGKMVGQVVSESPLGEGAKAIAKKGKVIETQASRFLLKSLIEFLGALVPKPEQDLSKAMGKA